MAESDATFDLLGKHSVSLADKIRKNARRIADEMIVGMSIEVNGKRVPAEQLTLKELMEEVTREIPR